MLTQVPGPVSARKRNVASGFLPGVMHNPEGQATLCDCGSRAVVGRWWCGCVPTTMCHLSCVDLWIWKFSSGRDTVIPLDLRATLQVYSSDYLQDFLRRVFADEYDAPATSSVPLRWSDQPSHCNPPGTSDIGQPAFDITLVLLELLFFFF